MTRSAFLRARKPEHKQQRRAAILDAARELAVASGVRNVSLGAVADAVGLAKSNIVRYFGTKEEIYLQLVSDEGREWAEALIARLGTAADTADTINTLAETLTERPLLCDLLSHLSTSLEHNVSVPAARAYKRDLYDLTDEMARRVSEVTGLTESESEELITIAGMLAGMLYPVANPPPTIVRLYAEDPELAARCPPFTPTLVRLLTAFAAGLPTLR